jgi:predicted ABC-type sugar transport system permease subunit
MQRVNGNSARFLRRDPGERIASTTNVPLALLVGRSLAVICHPLLAWRRLPPLGRVALAGGYATLSYVAALAALIALRA